MSAIISVPSDLLAQIGVQSVEFSGGFMPLVYIIAGIGLAFFVLEWIIARFREPGE